MANSQEPTLVLCDTVIYVKRESFHLELFDKLIDPSLWADREDDFVEPLVVEEKPDDRCID